MQWIDNIFVIFGVIVGWGLSQLGEYFKDRRGDKKKLKKLLFNLLELRYLLYKEFNLPLAFNEAMVLIRKKIEETSGKTLPDDDFSLTESIIRDMIKSHFDDSDKIRSLEEDINNILIDLSEIDPVFAYELNGQYNIKERLNKVGTLRSSYNEFLKKAPKDIIDSFFETPQLSDNLIKSLDEFLFKLANKISHKTRKQVMEKVDIQNKMFDDVEEFSDNFIEKIKSNVDI